MSIITKCPGCGTTFRVTPPQLQAQHGMVRCGRCANVFDGFKTLATLSDVTPPVVTPKVLARDDGPITAVAAPAAEEVRVDPAGEVLAAVPQQEHAAVASHDAFAMPESTSLALPDETAPREPPPAALVVDVAMAEPAPLPPAADVAQPAPVPLTQTAAAAPEPLLFATTAVVVPARRRRSGGWAFGALLLLAALAAQGAYLYRSEFAASVPEVRPYLNKMCEVLRCTVALPQRPRQISIEASDMQATDPANPGVIALTATLRNQATIELGYPALDVVLTNTKEHTVARRIFLPADYLAPGKDPRNGIAPNAEITVRLDLDTGDLGAAGFRLDVLAAPARL